ncbi:copper homeostasis protein CutC [Streptococcus sp. DD13]|uniref:copper homeostasis protein CutC n=1 Tax=Streptococcus sp. DD13 TaxID=1777881 RepID=UPI000798EF45|nr:copper homeostasis protein CutC [Streptococcus sp. DD13]KXT78529.1 Cytoplasmic copper homeostasis protein cutC [Streptococcus sp. DD13]
MPVYEFCAENITLLEKAFKAGASRVELCDNLAVGGTTPSYGVIKEAVRIAKMYQAKVIVMIRPRGGDFVYSPQELEIMLEDIQCARSLGVDGFATGVLTADDLLDKKALLTLLKASQGFEFTLHMAFDQLPEANQGSAIQWLKEQGVTRLLTRAGGPDTPLDRRLQRYKEFSQLADGQLEILAGGGISTTNRDQFLAIPGIEQVHGTRIVF